MRYIVLNNPFFEKPVLNSPYERPKLHWELDETGQPTQKIIESRRQVSFITAVPTAKRQRGSSLNQASLVFDKAAREYATDDQQYDLMQTINGVRRQVDRWREIPDQNQWRVTPETARLLRHWRHHQFSGIRPFFCQVEAVETAI